MVVRCSSRCRSKAMSTTRRTMANGHELSRNPVSVTKCVTRFRAVLNSLSHSATSWLLPKTSPRSFQSIHSCLIVQSLPSSIRS